MERYRQHRYAILLTFVALALVTFLGGIVNGVTATGRLLDDYTGEGVKDGQLSVGVRRTWSAADGAFVFENVPRTASIRVDAGGYLRTSAPAAGGDVRLSPLSVTVQVNVAGTSPAEGVPGAQVRQETRILGQMNPSGNTVISPHPGRDAKVTVCAKGFATKEVTVKGVILIVELARDAAGDCPPLPTPSPNPNATPTPAPTVAPTAAPSPSGSPR